MSRRHAAVASALVAWTTFTPLHTRAQEPATSPPLAFSSAPMLVNGSLPAPNVILSVADAQRAAQLGEALRAAVAPLPAQGTALRLGWQAAAQCEALPDAGALCQGRNAPAPLDDTRLAEFDDFVQRLASSAAPASNRRASHLTDELHTHLRQQPDAPHLQCRKTFQLLAAPGNSLPAQPRNPPHTAPTIARIDIDSESADVDVAAAGALQTALARSESLPTDTVTSLVAAPAAYAAAPLVLFAARYNADRWSGEVEAKLIDDATGAPPWGIQEDNGMPHTTATLLDRRDPDSRVILSSVGEAASFRGTAFRWDQLSASQQAALHDADQLGEQRLNYLRGTRGDEQASGGALRDRDSRQGDSVNAGLALAVGRNSPDGTPAAPAMFYLGSNAGMLHGFFADTGEEAFAYVPQGAYPALAALTRPDYRHRPGIDGASWTAEIRDGQRITTLLAAFPGAGSRGYFVLDVSDPAAIAKGGPSAADAVLLDTTAAADPDLGHITAQAVRERGEPSHSRQIAKLNDGRWALVIGNGFGSDNQRAVLLVQYLDGARELMKLPVGGAGSNGLSAVRLVDLDGDRRPDLAYGGDLHGQLWKFDLGSRDSIDWKVAFSGQPLFRSRDAKGTPQPITAAPLVVPHPAGGRMVVWGTGRLLTDVDRGDTAVQTVYGIHDKDDTAPLTLDRSQLVRQAIEPTPLGILGASTLWSSTSHAAGTQGESTGPGWYLDLPVAGERVVANPTAFDGKLVDVQSMAPPAALMQARPPESCDAPAIRNFRTTLNALDGARPRSQLYGEPGDAFAAASRIELGAQPSAMVPGATRQRFVRLDGSQEPARRRLDRIARRAGWRQLR